VPLVKERLTGAILLVALIVLLVPELLTGPVSSAPPVTVSASTEEPPLRSYTITLGEDARAHAAAQPASAAPQPVPAPEAVPANAPVAAAPSETTAPPPASQVAPAAGTGTPGAAMGEAPGAWMVQLGSFSIRANAEHLAQKLKKQGFAASVSQGTGGRHLYRVRVGPVPDHAAANQLQGKLQAAGHAGSVVPKYP
jgi:cell division septation protein DedD